MLLLKFEAQCALLLKFEVVQVKGGTAVACLGKDSRDEGQGDKASQAISDSIFDLAIAVAQV